MPAQPKQRKMIGGDFEAVFKADLFERSGHHIVVDLFHVTARFTYQVMMRVWCGHLIDFAACAKVAHGDEMLLDQKIKRAIDRGAVDCRRFFCSATVNLFGRAVAFAGRDRIQNHLPLRGHAKTALADEA